VIQRVVRRHMNEIRYCYERELVRDPTLRGTVRLSFVIGPDGRVVSATAERGDLPEGVTSCVVAAVRRWTFPAPDGGGVVAVTYPFVFTPGA
jgi:TonB family protein